MPQIRIISSPPFSTTSPTTATNNDGEIFLLEFQGKFETNGNVSLFGMEVGKLDLEGNNPVYYVGNQKLIGKEVKLAKPLAILKQQQSTDGASISLVSIIKKKILFDSRPITKMN